MEKDNLLTSPLNRIPEGLLDFFSIKSMGQYPQAFLPDVRGIMDLTRWYSDIQSQEGTALFSAIAANANAPLPIGSAQWLTDGVVDFADGGVITVVPQAELWLVLEATVNWTFNAIAASTAGFTLTSTRKFGSNQQLLVTDGDPQGFTASDGAIGRSGFVAMNRSPFIALPGSQFQVNQAGTVLGGTGTVTPRLSWRVKRLSR